MFEIAKKAGMTPADIAKLLRVSRITASLWFNGHAQPHHLLAARVRALLDAIGAAVAEGSLPISKEITRRERALVIRTVVAKHMKPLTVPELG